MLDRENNIAGTIQVILKMMLIPFFVLLQCGQIKASDSDSVLRDSLLMQAKRYQLIAGKLQLKGEYNRGIDLLKRALEIHKAYNDSVNMAKDIQIMADAYFTVGDIDGAEKKLGEVLILKQLLRDTTVFETYVSFVRLYNEQGKYIDAYKYLSIMEKYLDNRYNPLYKIYLLNSQSSFYVVREKYNDAEACLNKALDMCLKHGEDIMLSITYNNLGRLYLKQYNNVKALIYLEKAYELEKQNGNINGMLQKSVNISAAYFRLERYNDLKILLQDIIPKAREYGNKQVLAMSLFNLALTYEVEEQYILSLNEFKEALKVSSDINDVSAIHMCYFHMAYISKKLNNYKNAYRYQVFASEYKDSISENDFRTQIEKIEQDKRVLTAKLENESIKLDLNRERTKLITSQRNIILIALIGIVFIVIVIIIFRLHLKRQKRLIAEKEREQQKLTQEMVSKNAMINTKTEIIGRLGKKVKYTKSELDQMVFLLNEVQNLIDFVSDSLSNLVKKSRLAKVHQIPVAEELQRFRNLLEQRPSVKYGFKKNDGDIKARIRQRFPDLSKNETEMCLMLKLGFTTREIAAKNNTIYKSVEVARYRMRKRLGFNSVDDFMDELNEV